MSNTISPNDISEKILDELSDIFKKFIPDFDANSVCMDILGDMRHLLTNKMRIDHLRNRIEVLLEAPNPLILDSLYAMVADLLSYFNIFIRITDKRYLDISKQLILFFLLSTICRPTHHLKVDRLFQPIPDMQEGSSYIVLPNINKYQGKHRIIFPYLDTDKPIRYIVGILPEYD